MPAASAPQMNINQDEFSFLCRILNLRWADIAAIGECLRLLDQFGLLSEHLQVATANLHRLLGAMAAEPPEVSHFASSSIDQPPANSGLRPNWSPRFPLALNAPPRSAPGPPHLVAPLSA